MRTPRRSESLGLVQARRTEASPGVAVKFVTLAGGVVSGVVMVIVPPLLVRCEGPPTPSKPTTRGNYFISGDPSPNFDPSRRKILVDIVREDAVRSIDCYRFQ